MVNTLAILQARTTSSRLPNKVLEPIAGEPMLVRCVERIQRAFKIDRLVVATSIDATDDPIGVLCYRYNVDCFRGALEDVLKRFYEAACRFRPKQIVRLTADCPLIDPEVIDDVVSVFEKSDCDYCSNTIERTYPQGLDTEIFSFAALEAAYLSASDGYDREHVTPFLWRQPYRFRHAQVTDVVERSEMRWVVDTPSDLEFVRRVYDRLLPYGPAFSRDDVYDLLEERPELTAVNAGIMTDSLRPLHKAAA